MLLIAIVIGGSSAVVAVDTIAPPPQPVGGLQVVESRTAVTDAAGGHWSPDQYSHGGSITGSDARIENTDAPALYRSERLGIRAVDVPLRTNGTYLVVLYFAEITTAQPGQRTFAVIAQGRQSAYVDIARDVGHSAADHRAFTVKVTAKRLTLRFRAIRGQPVLSAISVRRVNTGIQLPATRPVWNDEFAGPAGSSPDPQKWNYDLGPGWHQLSDYTDRPANASLDGHGNLLIRARNDTYADPNGGSYRYTSVRMTTRKRFAMRYGEAEVRMQVSGQPGVVSTFWALGTDIDTVDWPRSGEIDPAEVRGSNPSVLVQALHMPCSRGDCAFVWETRMPAGLSAGFHTFAVERAPGVVLYSVDGRPTGSLTSADLPRGSWVFDKPFYLLLNLIVGGPWAGTPPPSDHWPITMVVDWVRVLR